MSSPLISICIPTYEMKGKGVEYLDFSFQKMAIQTFKDFEVVVSDHSSNNDIEKLCNSWSDKLNIRHIYNQENRGMFPHNMNNAINNAQGQIIKTLCQDDFLYDDQSLGNLFFNFTNNNNYWLVSACCHTVDGWNFYRPFYPIYNRDIQYGKNSISSPSVMMFKNENVIPFDLNLNWLVDCDYYKMLFDKYGLPAICNIITVVNREDAATRVSSTITEELMQKEYLYVYNKYNRQS
jgi:glycosyltransferase involved in cell wall biosynthesis